MSTTGNLYPMGGQLSQDLLLIRWKEKRKDWPLRDITDQIDFTRINVQQVDKVTIAQEILFRMKKEYGIISLIMHIHPRLCFL